MADTGLRDLRPRAGRGDQICFHVVWRCSAQIQLALLQQGVRVKNHKHDKIHTLVLKKETIAALGTDQLKAVAGGNLTTVKSQCPTMCFTLD